MIGRAQEEATRVQDIVVALEQQEITIGEFSDVIASLTSESIQVIGALLRNWSDPESNAERVSVARTLCREFASAVRVLS
jgi:hypothetical protein